MRTTAWFDQAREYAERLYTTNVQWSFNVTDLEDDAVFNIYAQRDRWHALRVRLEVTQQPDFTNETTEEYTIDGMTLAFNTPEVRDEPDGLDPAAREHRVDPFDRDSKPGDSALDDFFRDGGFFR